MKPTRGDTPETGVLSRLLNRLVPAWAEREDSEHQQAVIRLIVGVAAASYLVVVIVAGGGSSAAKLVTMIWIAAFFVVAVALVLWILKDPAANPTRRVLGSVLDNSAATGALFINGDLAAPLFVVYLWVTFGNGFRYGRRYLFLSMALGITGFCSVLFLSDVWTAPPAVSIGLATGLVVLPLYVASLLKDLETALVRAEVANRAKSNFLATMSHEIRTPLNGLIGVLELLDMTRLEGTQRHYVDLMKSSSVWLMSVISDGLDFTKIEANELIIEPVVTEIGTVISDITAIHEEVAGAKGLSFESTVAASVPRYLVCDKTRLAQVLNNLLDNAVTYTHQGHVKLGVTAEGLQDGRTRLCFRVEDTGVGIAEDDLDVVFLPFKQSARRGGADRGGTGLGLAIAVRLVELMGGAVEVESEPGVGTVFSFHIEAERASASEIGGRDRPTGSLRWIRQPHILLVEDNPTNLEVASAYLEHLECRVTPAADGFEAVDRFTGGGIDLVLMDCQMPRMDGYEAAREIRSIEDGGGGTPIVALTAHATNGDRNECFAAGMDDYMGKPYRLASLELMLRKWLGPLMAEGEAAGEEPTIDSVEADDASQRSASLHDLRNALAGMIGGVELALLRSEDQDRYRAHLETALESARRAVSIASELDPLQVRVTPSNVK